MTIHIDLNCDMGESYGAWTMGADTDVMPWVTSINVACGFHAGDPLTMARTLEQAAQHNLNVGAHIGLPDLAGFGRRTMAISAEETAALTIVQLGSLEAMARRYGLTPTHVKPHGALYHMLEQDAALAEAFVGAVKAVDPKLRITGLASGELCRSASNAALAVNHEAFCDRGYASNGQLLARGQPGAVLDLPTAVAQALQIVLHQQVNCPDGSQLPLQADTLCLHGDRPDAALFARSLHQALNKAGVELRGVGE